MGGSPLGTNASGADSAGRAPAGIELPYGASGACRGHRTPGAGPRARRARRARQAVRRLQGRPARHLRVRPRGPLHGAVGGVAWWEDHSPPMVQAWCRSELTAHGGRSRRAGFRSRAACRRPGSPASPARRARPAACRPSPVRAAARGCVERPRHIVPPPGKPAQRPIQSEHQGPLSGAGNQHTRLSAVPVSQPCS